MGAIHELPLPRGTQMPITKELDNLRKFESVGFSHEQAKILTDVIEQSHINGQQSLKEFFHNELSGFKNEIHNELNGFRKEMDDFRKEVRNEINTLELRMKASQTDLLVKIFGIVVGCTSMAVAVSKLLG